MSHVGQRIPHLVDLMEHIVSEKLDDVSIACLRPTQLMCEAVSPYATQSSARPHKGKHSLGPLIDEAELAQQSDKAGIFKLTHKLVLDVVRVPAQRARPKRPSETAQSPKPGQKD